VSSGLAPWTLEKEKYLARQARYDIRGMSLIKRVVMEKRHARNGLASTLREIVSRALPLAWLLNYIAATSPIVRERIE
jgi:hypothetical protein